MAPRILLIGPPGAGKSSIGRALARTMEIDFADTDSLIEADQGKSVSQIFVDDGEPIFREIEERICLSALKKFDGVLALGGGAPLLRAVAEKLRQLNGEIVFLDVSLAVAAPRVGFNRDRPLLLNNPRQQWQKMMDVRRPTYQALASITVEVGDRSISKIVKELMTKVNK
jgi:shikimate kinase